MSEMSPMLHMTPLAAACYVQWGEGVQRLLKAGAHIEHEGVDSRLFTLIGAEDLRAPVERDMLRCADILHALERIEEFPTGRMRRVLPALLSGVAWSAGAAGLIKVQHKLLRGSRR